jgi:hypothetical protein
VVLLARLTISQALSAIQAIAFTLGEQEERPEQVQGN